MSTEAEKRPFYRHLTSEIVDGLVLSGGGHLLPFSQAFRVRDELFASSTDELGGFAMQEETETQKAIWTPPHATQIDLERTLNGPTSNTDMVTGEDA